MLVKLLTIICSLTINTVLAAETVIPSFYNVFPQHSNVQILEPNVLDEKIDLKEVPVVPLIKSNFPTSCPANKILLQIESILAKLLKKVYVDSNESNNINGVQETDQMSTNKDIPNRDAGQKNLAVLLSKTKSLRELLDENNLTRHLKTKITVQYELPSDADLSCKQALSEVLDILRNSNLLHDHCCGSYKDCNNINIVTKDKDENNENGFSSHDKYLTNNLIKSYLDWMKFINYIASKQNKLHNTYVTKEQEIPYFPGKSGVSETVNEFGPDNSASVHSNGLENDPFNNSKYKLLVTENILPSVHTPDNFNNENLNLSEIVRDNLIEANTQVPIVKKINHDAEVKGKPEDVFINTTSDEKTVSSFPVENHLSRSSNKKVLKGDEPYNVDTSGPNTLFLNDVSEITNNRINPVLSMIKPGDERTKLLTSLIQSNFRFKPLPQLTSDNIRYPYLMPYYMEPNKENTEVPHQDTLYNKYYTYNKESRDQTFSKVSSLNTVSNQGNTWSKAAYYTPHVGENPYFVNSKLVDYGQYVNQLHAYNNLENFQRIVGVTNLLKLNTAPDNSGVVELTYVLRRPSPVTYQPSYFVKYRMPYDSFLNNVRYLLLKKPELRSDPAKLYQKLLTATKVAEISPSLKGVSEQNLLQMVANNGALVKTKIVKVNDTILNKQLETVHSVNSDKTPNELINVAYSIQLKTEKKSDLLKNGVQHDFLNELKTEKEKIDNNNVDSSIFIPYKVEDKNNDFTSEVPAKQFLGKSDSGGDIHLME